MDDMTLRELKVTERLLGGEGVATIERTLLYRDEPVANVYLEQNANDCTIAWPLEPTINLTELFDGFQEFITEINLKAQWWIGDQFSERDIVRQKITSLWQDLRQEEAKARAPLDLALLIYGDEVIEVAFGGTNIPAPPVRVAMALRSVSDKFLKLFSRFHPNKSIQMNPDIAYTAFVAPTGQGFQMLGPVSTVP